MTLLTAVNLPARTVAASSWPARGAEAQLQLSSRTQPTPSKRLPREADLPLLRSLGSAFDSLSVETELVNTRRDAKDLRIAVHRYGVSADKDILIFIHGVLVDHTTWRYMAGAVAGTHELWMIDLPGCGLSDAPNPRSLGPDGYSPTAMGERIFQALDHMLRQTNLEGRQVILVAHSLGGTIALRMFGNPDFDEDYGHVRDQIDGLLLFSPSDVAINAEIPLFVGIINLNGTKVTIGKTIGIVRSRVATSTRDGFHTPDRATLEQADHMVKVLTTRDQRRATQAMLVQAVPWRMKEHRPDWPEIEKLASHHANVDCPTLIVWGEWDEILPASMGHKLRDEIPGAKLIRMPNCGHSVPNEAPVECASILRQFLESVVSDSFESMPAIQRFDRTAIPTGSVAATTESAPQR